MVKVYISDISKLQTGQLPGELYMRLPVERQRKLDRIKLPQDKLRSACSFLLLSKALKEQDADLLQEEIAYGENGKPYIKDRENLYFNLSHSGDRVMCAVSDTEVGCDVEQIKEVNLKLAKRFFGKEEYCFLSELTSKQEQNIAFCRLWTVKESVMKLTGLGMKLPLDSIKVAWEDQQACVTMEWEGRAVYTREYDLQDGYRYACCSLEDSFAEEPLLVELV